MYLYVPETRLLSEYETLRRARSSKMKAFGANNRGVIFAVFPTQTGGCETPEVTQSLPADQKGLGLRVVE